MPPHPAAVVFHGTTIAQWRKAEYHKQPEHAAFAQLLEAPQVGSHFWLKVLGTGFKVALQLHTC